MKRKFLTILALGTGLLAMAQGENPEVIAKFNCHNMSANGEWMIGRSKTWQDPDDGSFNPESSLCNVKTGEIFGYADLFTLTPVSRNISSKGIAIVSTDAVIFTGPDMYEVHEMPYILVPGEEPIELNELYDHSPSNTKECYAAAIADDASAFLGYFEAYPQQYPFLCTINEDLTIGEPEFFPLPQKDIFGQTPYAVELTCISDDCNTVAGLVACKNATVVYPIIYTRGENGEWTYNCPTAHLYDSADPSSFPSFYYAPSQAQVALSPDGTKFAATQALPGDVDNFDTYKIWVFDLENDTYSVIESENPDLVATGILNDGTVIGTFFGTVVISYIKTPSMQDFIDFAEYIIKLDPTAQEWIDKNLMVKAYDVTPSGDMVEVILPYTGQVFVSNDLSVIGAGRSLGEGFSYVFSNMPALGDTSAPVLEKNPEGVFNVYNLTGVKVLTTSEPSQLNKLVKGIYIVNGKKFIIK